MGAAVIVAAGVYSSNTGCMDLVSEAVLLNSVILQVLEVLYTAYHCRQPLLPLSLWAAWLY